MDLQKLQSCNQSRICGRLDRPKRNGKINSFQSHNQTYRPSSRNHHFRWKINRWRARFFRYPKNDFICHPRKLSFQRNLHWKLEIWKSWIRLLKLKTLRMSQNDQRLQFRHGKGRSQFHNRRKRSQPFRRLKTKNHPSSSPSQKPKTSPHGLSHSRNRSRKLKNNRPKPFKMQKRHDHNHNHPQTRSLQTNFDRSHRPGIVHRRRRRIMIVIDTLFIFIFIFIFILIYIYKSPLLP